MQNNYNKQTLEQKMTLLCKKWEGKPVADKGTKEYLERIIDRLRYKNYKEELAKLNGEIGEIGQKAYKEDSYELAKEMFEVR
jgi:hypothetical protein